MAHSAMGRLLSGQRTLDSLRQSVSSLTQTRAMGTTSKVLPFKPTQVEELNQALHRFREELFIPFSLPGPQRKTMFKQSNAQRLLDEPITVDISENEQYTLKPLNKGEMPKRKDAVKVLDLMERNNTWENLFPFTVGLETANRNFKPEQWERIIAALGKNDKLHLAISCARYAKRTGLRLNNMDVVRRLFFEIHRTAQMADFEDKTTTNALSLAHQAVNLMEQNPEHAVKDASRDPKRQPFVIGTLLELAASRALLELNTVQGTEQVLMYARRLLACWPLGKFKFDPEHQDPQSMDTRLMEEVIVWNGLNMAIKVPGVAPAKDVYAQVKQRKQDIEGLIKKRLGSLSREEAEKKSLPGYRQAVVFFKDSLPKPEAGKAETPKAEASEP
ncbi:uncharacterized protein PFLUO_LOCUS5649 [Penicillium psychrofluorescens]|uniref:uncharacterized protein n=1 Tax=Penicillium psychrofluorescens TaxID=3158075 RepID=UPI003CCD75F7